MLDPAAIGARLKAVRQRIGWTRPKAASKASRSVKWLQRIEQDGTYNLHKIRHLCRVYDIHPGTVLLSKADLLSLLSATVTGLPQEVNGEEGAGDGIDR